MYDWAISAVQVGIVTAIFPIYYVKVAGAGLIEGKATQHLATANTVSLAFVALLSPILGAAADYVAAKKRFLAAFMLLGLAAIAAMFFIHTGDLLLASILFVLAMIGATGSFVFSILMKISAASRGFLAMKSFASRIASYTTL